jgi:hypothetical protein
MSGDIRTMWNHLAVETDEAVVLSTVYETASGTPVLMAASLLVGPAGIANTGWPGWRLAEGFKPQPDGLPLEVLATFTIELESAVVGRVTMSQTSAYDWLRSVLEQGVCPSVGGLPEARASLAPATAPIRVCTHSQTQAGDLATYMTRPINGFHFPRTDEPAGLEAARWWTVDGMEIPMAAVELLGFSWFPEKTGKPPAGLLLGRFERRAWLVSQKLVPEHDLYTVEIGIEPDRAELADLEIEVEEQAGEELVFAEHLRLEDVDIRAAEQALYGPPPAHGRLETGVALPTLGRRMKRLVRLTHRDGTLLDEWRSFNIVESISFTLVVDGAEQSPVTTGDTREAQDVVELLGAVERVRSQYATMRREGTANRVFEDLDEGRNALRAILERAPGELLVVDAYLRDWQLLTNLGGPPPRVLIGEAVPPPPEEFVGAVGRWRDGLAPFHDRFFLWDGGGVSVGTSAGAIHDRLFRIVRMGAAESEALRSRFALWWQDPGFEKL